MIGMLRATHRAADGVAADFGLYLVGTGFAGYTAAASTLPAHRAWGGVALFGYAVATTLSAGQLLAGGRWRGTAVRWALLGLASAAGEPTLETLGSGAHLLVRWTGPGAIVRSAPTAGTYRIRALGTRVTVTGLPRMGTLLAPGAIVARLESVDGLAVAGGSALRAEVADLVTGPRRAFGVGPIPDGGVPPGLGGIRERKSTKELA